VLLLVLVTVVVLPAAAGAAFNAALPVCSLSLRYARTYLCHAHALQLL
jgi:hypothetical protein